MIARHPYWTGLVSPVLGFALWPVDQHWWNNNGRGADAMWALAGAQNSGS
jgi:hypothetical protein